MYQFNEIQLQYKKSDVYFSPITRSIDTADVLRNFYDANTIELTEQFYTLFLNRQNEVIGIYHLSNGGITGTVADIRLLFSAALKYPCTSIIISHNHPSGQLKPSRQDIELTAKIKEAGKLLDINLLDHVIMTSNSYYSFLDECYL